MGGAILSKSLIQFSVDGWCCVPSLLFTWGQTMVEIMKIMATSFQRSHAHTGTLSAPALQEATADPRLSGDSWTLTGNFGSVSCGITAPFSWVQVCTSFSGCARWSCGCMVLDDCEETPHVQGQKSPNKKVGTGAAAAWRWSDFEEIHHVQGQSRSCSKLVGGVKSHLGSNPIPTRDAQRIQTNLVHNRTQRPRD